MQSTTHTLPISPLPGQVDRSARLAASAAANDQVGGTNSRAGEPQGTISARIEFKIEGWVDA